MKTMALGTMCAAVLATAMVTTAHAEVVTLSTTNNVTLGGVVSTDDDLTSYNQITGTTHKIFDGFSLLTDVVNKDEDVDAVHILDNGHIVFSTISHTSIAGLAFNDDDLVDYDPVNNVASLLFDGSTLFSNLNEDVNAASILANGHIVLSTTSTATLGGLTFKDDDLVDYDPVADLATKIFDGTALLEDQPNIDEDIDAVHMRPNGNIIFSTTHATSISGLTFGDEDLVEYNPTTGSASIFFDGSVLLTNTLSDVDVNAAFVAVPEPGSWLLISTSLLGCMVARRRARA